MRPVQKSKTADAMQRAKQRGIERLSAKERMKLALYLGHRGARWKEITGTDGVSGDSDSGGKS